MFKKIVNYFSSDLAIDLGTSNILIYSKDRGIIVNEPSVVAVQIGMAGTRDVLAVGRKAKQMIGRNPGSIEVIRPMRNGVIADFEMTQTMLKYFIKKSLKDSSFVKPRIIICIPFGITQVEKRAVKESAEQAGGREVYLIEEPMAAAIGAGLPITQPSGNMVVDIGGGTTEVAIISLGGIVFSKSIRVAGDKFDEVIVAYMKKKHSLLIGDQTAEAVKMSIGNAFPTEGKASLYDVKGRDLISGSPKVREVSSDEIRLALTDSISEIVGAIKLSLEKAPPELASDIIDNGILLTGGGSLLANLDILIREKTGLPVLLADEPLISVVVGCGRVLESPTLLKQVTYLG